MVNDRNVEVARHKRLIAKGSCRLDLDHYLEALIRKPGAFPGATALEQARSAGKFTPVHDAWWAQARKIHGERDGTRALIEVGTAPAAVAFQDLLEWHKIRTSLVVDELPTRASLRCVC